MNPDLNLLQAYPFEKLKSLKAQIHPPANLEHIPLAIGEPKHEPPEFVQDCIAKHVATLGNYPSTKGLLSLRKAIGDWATRRFLLQPESLDPEQNILPVNGTREALFSFTQAVIDRSKNPLVISPNPFYQIYEGATFLAGAQPYFLNCSTENYLPDFDVVPPDIWQRCQMLFLCTPGNPTGSVIDIDTLKKLIALADEYNFIIASDECYSELYFDEAQPPIGLLQACAEMGRHDYSRCVVFHSLSKRSNLPGLRSGFVAGDREILEKFLLYRTYHGCAMPIGAQMASTLAWQDETHVIANRDLYRRKFDAVLAILSDELAVKKPDAGFYLWPRTPISDIEFTQQLFIQQHVTVLPGRFIARDTPHGNPGHNHVRMALVAPLDQCIEAAQRIRQFLTAL